MRKQRIADAAGRCGIRRYLTVIVARWLESKDNSKSIGGWEYSLLLFRGTTPLILTGILCLAVVEELELFTRLCGVETLPKDGELNGERDRGWEDALAFITSYENCRACDSTLKLCPYE